RRKPMPVPRAQEKRRGRAQRRRGGGVEGRGMSKTVDFGVGKSAPQIEAQEKVCGSAQFIAALYRPNILFGAVLRSPHAPPRILNYDLSQALAMTGVRGIVTGDD